MQVKKFEAKTMQEALKLVKQHLGPEAVILSAKDNSRSFGIAGSKSIEVTAAVSEETLRKKKIAEAKLNEKLKSKYVESSARVQKEFIDKAMRPKSLEEDVVAVRPPTKTPYIEISDGPTSTSAASAQTRIKEAAERAWKASKNSLPEEKAKAEGEVELLKAEILRLSSIIESFKKMPQTFINLHPGAESGLSFELSESYQRLVKSGVEKSFATDILKKAEGGMPKEQLSKPALIDAWVAHFILDYVRVAQNRTAGKYHLFFGGPGQGKSTALIKLASHLVVKDKKKIAIVTTDTTKVGAAEQMRLFAQILNVPFAVVRTPQDWALLEAKLLDFDHVLVDYPGLTLRTVAEIDRFRELIPPQSLGRKVHYVQSALARDTEEFETAKRYQVVGFDDVIFTHLDNANTHGCILNFLNKFHVPLHSFSTGPQIPEDFEAASKERVVDLIFKISKFKRREGADE